MTLKDLGPLNPARFFLYQALRLRLRRSPLTAYNQKSVPMKLAWIWPIQCCDLRFIYSGCFEMIQLLQYLNAYFLAVRRNCRSSARYNRYLDCRPIAFLSIVKQQVSLKSFGMICLINRSVLAFNTNILFSCPFYTPKPFITNPYYRTSILFYFKITIFLYSSTYYTFTSCYYYYSYYHSNYPYSSISFLVVPSLYPVPLSIDSSKKTILLSSFCCFASGCEAQECYDS